jgi:hypothetical protein
MAQCESRQLARVNVLGACRLGGGRMPQTFCCCACIGLELEADRTWQRKMVKNAFQLLHLKAKNGEIEIRLYMNSFHCYLLYGDIVNVCDYVCSIYTPI